MSFFARRRDDEALRAFVKTLRRPRSWEARKRFRREAAAYETLGGPGIPRLIEHNSHEWTDKRAELFLVLEPIDGPSLAAHIEKCGSLAAEHAISTVLRVATIVGRCHEQDVVHRDLKPANIVLRGGDLLDPMVVDFGLSFNKVDNQIGEVTRIGEEVGNRFLRLPEHASGGRDFRSDVTMLVGLLHHALTGREPKVLRDESGCPPQGRPEERAILEEKFEGRRLLRVLSIFDRGFSLALESRFQSVDEFIAAVEGVPGVDDSVGDVAAEFAEFFSQAHLREPREARATLGPYFKAVTGVARRINSEHGTGYSGPALDWKTQAGPPRLEVGLGLFVPSDDRSPGTVPHTKFIFELVDGEEVVMWVTGVERWRGRDPSAAQLASAIEEALMTDLLNRVEPDRKISG